MNNSFDQRTLNTIDSAKTYASSPLVQALILWHLHDHSAAQTTSQKLADSLLATCDEDWFRTNSLTDGCIILGSLYTFDAHVLSGSVLAQVTQRLLKAEVAVGGPYTNEKGQPDAMTNSAVAFLMRALGSPLPNVEVYLQDKPVPTGMLLPSYPRSALLVAAQNLRRSPTASTKTKQVSQPYQCIVRQVQADIGILSEPLRTSALAMLDKLQAADKNKEMLLFPRFFANSLISSLPSDSLLHSLGVANLYTWMAYTIFDDFLDDEGESTLLPVATTAFQKTLYYLTQVAPIEMISSVFIGMDQANAWEVAHCRFARVDTNITITALPRYRQRQQLANRSFGHALGPLIISHQLPHITPAQRDFIATGLRHYLIARQLNDDAHDWREDIEAGQASYVVTTILRSMHVDPGTYDLASLIRRMEHSFWHTDVRTVCDYIVHHVVASRQAFAASGLFTGQGDFFELLGAMEAIARRTMKGQREQQAFLQTYKKS